MQSVVQETTPQDYHSTSYVVTIEILAIGLLISIILFTRLLSLDAVPLSENETHNALAAWRFVSPPVVSVESVSNSPVMFWTQATAFSVLGSNEFSARIVTAIAGVLLCLSPLLFRDMIGRSRAYIVALLLTFSPVMIASARLSSGMTWVALFAVLFLWLSRRYQHSEKQSSYAVAAIVAFVAMMFLSDSGGILMGFILIGAGVIASVLTAYDMSDENTAHGDDFMREVVNSLYQIPWRIGALFAGFTVAAVATGMLLYPAGLSSVSELIGDFLLGVMQRQPDAPLFFPLFSSLFYDFWLWILASAALVAVVMRSELDFSSRFMASWLVLGVVVSVLYPGGGSSDAVWFVIPLVYLASYLIDDAFIEGQQPTLWMDSIIEYDGNQTNILEWGKWLLAFLMFVLLIMASVHFQIIARAFLDVPNGSLNEIVNRLSEAPFAKVARSMIWLVISYLFMGVGYFLAASIWGGLTTTRGALIGILGFVMLSGLSTGWNITVDNADDPREVWHTHAISTDVKLLRQTIQELASRHTGGFPLVPIAVIDKEDGIIAWQLRDFSNAYFVPSIAEARGEEIVVAPSSNEEPDLGGSYVGQKFAIQKVWNVNTQLGFDWLAWGTERRSRILPQATNDIILWVRQDIFDGTDFERNVPGAG